MSTRLNRYHIVVIFLLFSVLLHMGLRFITGLIFSHNFPNDFIAQISLAIEYAKVLYGIYVFILVSLALSGIVLARKRGNKEHVIGFKLVFYLSVLMVVLYLVALAVYI